MFHITLGDYSVCVNAATMALIDAGIPMKDYVCACSASYIEDTPILGKLVCLFHLPWENEPLSSFIKYMQVGRLIVCNLLKFG